MRYVSHNVPVGWIMGPTHALTAQNEIEWAVNNPIDWKPHSSNAVSKSPKFINMHV
jgi:hypothetical protein